MNQTNFLWAFLLKSNPFYSISNIFSICFILLFLSLKLLHPASSPLLSPACRATACWMRCSRRSVSLMRLFVLNQLQCFYLIICRQKFVNNTKCCNNNFCCNAANPTRNDISAPFLQHNLADGKFKCLLGDENILVWKWFGSSWTSCNSTANNSTLSINSTNTSFIAYEQLYCFPHNAHRDFEHTVPHLTHKQHYHFSSRPSAAPRSWLRCTGWSRDSTSFKHWILICTRLRVFWMPEPPNSELSCFYSSMFHRNPSVDFTLIKRL